MNVFLSILILIFVTGCASVYPLGQMARRTEDPRSLHSDVTVDTSSRYLTTVRTVAWAAYSVDFECEKKCDYSLEERKAIAQEIADTSFTAFDREIRALFSGEES